MKGTPCDKSSPADELEKTASSAGEDGWAQPDWGADLHPAIRDNLRPIATGLAALYLVSAVNHLALRPEVIGLPVLAITAATVLSLLGIRWFVGRSAVPVHRAKAVGLATASLILLNSILHLYYLSDSNQVLNLLMLATGVACFLLPSRRQLLVLVVVLATWLLVVVVATPSSAWLYFAFGLLASMALRFQAEVRRSELQTAFEAARHEVMERRRMERALRDTQERYELAARGANDGLWDWDLQENTVYYSTRWKAIAGHEDDEIGSSPEEWFQKVHPDDVDLLRRAIRQHLSGQSSHFQHEYRLLHKDREYRWVLSRGLAVRDESGRAYRVAGSQTDVTERKQAEQRLFHDALHDALTGLPNRALLLERLGNSLKQARSQPGYLVALLFLDLDRFKVINDSLGHAVGDELLVAVALRLKTCLRPKDTVARIGGDEFAILMEDVGDPSEASILADRILGHLKTPFSVSGREIFTSASIGIALSNATYERPEDLLRDADTALYQAKRLGKCRYEVFDSQMHVSAVTLLQLESDLRQALGRGEMRVYYQPIVALPAGHITGFEALIRWQHPSRELIPPSEFIPLAEETGLILSLDHWVLGEACRQTQEWDRLYSPDPPLWVSVNLSGRHFSQSGLVAEARRILEKHSFDPQRLRLEIAEEVLTDNAQSAIDTLSQLRSMGVQIYLDDFGTGYSSLNYLHFFLIDGSKIARSLTMRLSMGKENRQLVHAVVNLAHNLGMDVVAKGVETADQLMELQMLNCTYVQGFCFSRPLEPEAAGELLRLRHRYSIPQLLSARTSRSGDREPWVNPSFWRVLLVARRRWPELVHELEEAGNLEARRAALRKLLSAIRDCQELRPAEREVFISRLVRLVQGKEVPGDAADPPAAFKTRKA